jgi:hypothetical protein
MDVRKVDVYLTSTRGTDKYPNAYTVLYTFEEKVHTTLLDGRLKRTENPFGNCGDMARSLPW